MPTFLSKDGVWYPSKERVALRNNSKKTITNPSGEGSKYYGEKVKPGDEFIYEGPDRAALFMLFQEKVETLGMDFKYDMEFINRIRQIHGCTVDEYLVMIGYDKEQIEKEFKKKATVVNKHQISQAVKSVGTLGGGVDTTGMGKNFIGDFGEPQLKEAE